MSGSGGAPSPAGRDTRWGFCDPHVHTSFSDGLDPPEEVVDYADRLGWLDVVAITDHHTVEGGLRAREHAARSGARISVVVGQEISTRDGHVVALFISETIPRWLSAAETVQAIHEAGGIAVAAHPFWHPGRYGVASLAGRLPFDAVEVLNGAPSPRTLLANRRSRRHRQEFGDRACTGGSDAHLRQAVGSCCTAFEGRDATAFRAAIERGTTKPVRLGLPSPRYALVALRRLRPRP